MVSEPAMSRLRSAQTRVLVGQRQHHIHGRGHDNANLRNFAGRNSAAGGKWRAVRDDDEHDRRNGIFASPANSGVHDRTVFAALPSGNFKLNYDLLPNLLTLSLCYNVFWIRDVLRASNQLVGVNAPTCAQSNILAQDVTIGAKVKF